MTQFCEVKETLSPLVASGSANFLPRKLLVDSCLFSSDQWLYQCSVFCILQSVLEGYNGTVMAYGQTGTGKTFTLGRLGEEDTAARGIMVRAMEDILADITPETDTVSVSYLQVCDSRSSHGIVYTFSNFNVWLSCSCVVVNVYYVYYCSCIWK